MVLSTLVRIDYPSLKTYIGINGHNLTYISFIPYIDTTTYDTCTYVN